MSLINKIESMLITGNEYTPFELQRLIAMDGRLHSDSTITMALRKLRTRGHDVKWRYKDGTRTTVYRIAKKQSDNSTQKA